MSQTEPPDERTRSRGTSGIMYTSNLRWLSGFVSLVGAWIFVSAFVYGTMSMASFCNNIIIGAAIFLVARYNYTRMSRGLAASVGTAVLVAILGLWMIIVPFFMTVGAAYWSDIISEIVVAIVSGYTAYTEQKVRLGQRRKRPELVVQDCLFFASKRMYNAILIPTDGEKGTVPVIEHGIRIAEKTDAKIHALYVIDLPHLRSSNPNNTLSSRLYLT